MKVILFLKNLKHKTHKFDATKDVYNFLVIINMLSKILQKINQNI